MQTGHAEYRLPILDPSTILMIYKEVTRMSSCNSNISLSDNLFDKTQLGGQDSSKQSLTFLESTTTLLYTTVTLLFR